MEGLTPKELLFVEAYCGVASFSATKAYELAGYSMRGAASTIRREAISTLSRPHIEKAVATRLSARVKELRGVMGGDEALERLSTIARSDIGLVLADGDPLKQLPADVRMLIKAVRPGRYGRVIELHDAMRAQELMAKAAGKLRDQVEHSGKVTLEDLVCGVASPASKGASA